MQHAHLSPHTLRVTQYKYNLNMHPFASFLGNPLLLLWQGVAAKIFKSSSKVQNYAR